jgi:hypothetical protein
MSDDLIFRRFVENQIWMGQSGHASDGGIVCPRADVRMLNQNVDNGLNAGLHAPRPAANVSRGNRGWIQDRQGPGEYSEASQTMPPPNRPHLFIGGEFAARGGGLGGFDGRTFVIGKEHRRDLVVGAGQAENDARDVILRVGGQVVGGGKSTLEQARHSQLSLKTIGAISPAIAGSRRHA